jgi:signal transduction histidine kinase
MNALLIACLVLVVAAGASAIGWFRGRARERAGVGPLLGRLASLESFAAHVESATERDRAEISRDMHDQIGGLLVAAKMDLDWVGRRLPLEDEAARAKLAQVAASLDKGLSVKREFVERLRPSILDHLGLFAALQWQLTEMCGAAGIECECRVPDGDPEFAPAAAIRIFRIEHDALAHAIGSPGTALIELDARVTGDALEIAITDDAEGPAGAEPSSPPWVSWLDHRAASLGGSCFLERRPDGGARLHVRVPIARLRVPPAD